MSHVNSKSPSPIRNLLILGSPLLWAALQGCVKIEDLTPASATSSSATVTTPSENGVAYLRLEHAWEGSGAYTSLGTCSIPSGATTYDCQIAIPEGKLYYSDLRFVVGTSDPANCSIVVFRPYYYVASTSAGFIPPWKGSAVDCSVGAPDNIDCYDGVAKEIIGDFPTYKGTYHIAATRAETAYDVDSANSLQNPTNRFTCNSLDVAARGVTIPGEYILNTMQDYRVQCRDIYNDVQATLNVTLVDQDTAGGETPGGPLDHFSDWND